MFNVRVEYECAPIRHISVQCPSCGNWFFGCDVTNDDLLYSGDIYFAEFKCPVCDESFSEDCSIEEVSYPEVYDGCLKKKVTWEQKIYFKEQLCQKICLFSIKEGMRKI